MITVPYNDEDALKEVVSCHGDELSGFILEPVLGAGGMIPARPEYLESARDLTESTETLLIFDEVITSRLSTGGVQQTVDVLLDLTVLGKYIEWGVPIGVFGGRPDVMNVFDIPVQATGTGSLFQIHFTDAQITDPASAGSNDEIRHRFHLAM